MSAVKGQDDLAVAACLVLIVGCRSLADGLVIVDFPIDGKHLPAVGTIERLLAALRIHDAQTLVAQDGMPSAVDAAPVRTAVTNLLAHAQSLVAQLGGLLLDVKYTYYSTHC